MAALARRDACAFRVIVDRHGRDVHRLAYRMLGDAAEAEDVVQECLLRLWDTAASWRPIGGGLTGWLRRVATNQCIDRVRRHRRLSSEPVPERADDAPGADEVMVRHQTAIAVQRALQALPDRQRAAVVLTYHEALSNPVAAEALGLKLKAFESLLVRARTALRHQLAAIDLTGRDAGCDA